VAAGAGRNPSFFCNHALTSQSAFRKLSITAKKKSSAVVSHNSNRCPSQCKDSFKGEVMIRKKASESKKKRREV